MAPKPEPLQGIQNPVPKAKMGPKNVENSKVAENKKYVDIIAKELAVVERNR